MNNFKIFSKFAIVVLVLLLTISQEAEARRKILKGRKAITRVYYKDSPIPSWAVVLLVAISELLVGVLSYIGLKILILDRPIKPRYVPATSIPSTP